MRKRFYTILRSGSESLILVSEQARTVALQSAGEKPAFFMVDSFPYFIDVVKLLGTDRPVLSLIRQEETQTSESYSIIDEASVHVNAIRAHQPRGPYLLGGCSASAIVAYEAAQQLRALGHEVALLVLFDTPNPNFACDDPRRMRWRELPGWAAGKFGRLFIRQSTRLRRTWSATDHGALAFDQFGPVPTRIAAALNYRPQPYSGRLLLFKRDCNFTDRGRYLDPQFGWGEVAMGEIDICLISAADHLGIFKGEVDRRLVADTLRTRFDQVAEIFQTATQRAREGIVA
jgi:thioesterase domain-containing protein